MRSRVICVGAGDPAFDRRTLAALPPLVERIVLGVDPEAYWRLIRELWDQAETFTIIERDIEIHPGVLDAFDTCAEPWCTFAYPGRDRVIDSGLGCTRFRGSLMLAEPDTLELPAPPVRFSGLPPNHWQFLDQRIAHALAMRGYAPHVHGEVIHHHAA
jgi:hypothetical protein